MDVSNTNPFPGINPWMQHRWTDVHSTLITYIRDALAQTLSAEFRVSSEEAVNVVGGAEDGQRYYTDVGIRDVAKKFAPLTWELEEQGDVAVAEPMVVEKMHPTARWVEISDRAGRLITVIEVLSPSNKAAGLEEYRAKINKLSNAGVSVVEIDLIRGGKHAVAVSESDLPDSKEERSIICVSRDKTPQRIICEVYLTPITRPLPGIRIPLRHGDTDAALAIQPLMDRCYAMGRYWQTDYHTAADPPLAQELSPWALEKLQAAGFPAGKQW